MNQLFSVVLIAFWALGVPSAQAADTTEISRPPEDEIIYFVLPDRFENGDPSNDRGGIDGDRLRHGFDPTNNGFYQGGDLKGLTDRLDYIQGLGATAIWLSPIFENKAVQGPSGSESAGYHGYWITDFLNVDPHLGTRADFKAFVDAAHARGMKVYMDIITNHSADVIKYEECHGPNAPEEYRSTFNCPYRSVGDFPYTTKGDANGQTINEGFLGAGPNHQTSENFGHLTDMTFAYTPFVPEEEKSIKNPSWLNDVRFYHNRGDTTWEGENSRTGDFSGLDDLMTSNPAVVDGFIDIYKQWITDFRVDGFRIDTAKHVNPEFWQAFAPAILDHARSEGIEHFHVFGEVYEFDVAQLAKFTTYDDLPTVLDFAFQGTVRRVVAEDEPARDLERLFEADTVYADGFATAKQLPTFLGNHDMGRFSMFVRDANPELDEDGLQDRIVLGHAMMMFLRGVPTIYYGDEQGFVSDAGDRGARETMFKGQTQDYLDNDLVGTKKTVADENFDRGHPIYKALTNMAKIRTGEPALRGGTQTVRHSDLKDGLIVVSRFDPADSAEIIVAFNADDTPRSIAFPVDGRAKK
ncbi:MAG: alpha-amylase family glycosyl hydrolase, partial [Pseudomonadota bacterium]